MSSGKYFPGFQFGGPFGAPFGAMTDAVRAGQARADREIEPATKACGLAHCEMMALMSRRGRAYVDLPTKLSQAKSPMEIFTVQQNFWQQCVQDYAKAASAIGEAWSDILPITGVAETFEDQSLKSSPSAEAGRDRLTIEPSVANRKEAVPKAA